jgi:CBS domain-containing protein
MTTVAEILGPNRLCVSSSTLISEVARKMRDYGLELIAVCESGKFRGVVTEKEIISKIVASAQYPEGFAWRRSY